MENITMPKQSRTRILPRIGFLMCISVMICLFLASDVKASARTVSFTLRVGQKALLQLEGVTERLPWKVQNGGKRVKLKSNGLVIAKKTGKTTIKVVYEGVTYRFKIKIKAKKKKQSKAVRTVALTPILKDKVADKNAVPKANLSTKTLGTKYAEGNVILVGDSRFVGMSQTVGGSATWIAAVGEGLNWLNSTVIPRLKDMDVKGKVVVFNLGVNDIGAVSSYVSVLNSLGADLRSRGAAVYFMTVNPVDEKVEKSHGYSVTNASIVSFDQTMAGSLTDFGLIDTYDYLAEHGFATVDGVHYAADTYRAIYAVLRDAIIQ